MFKLGFEILGIELPPITTCPQCEYCLTGSRETLRCPECGRAYSLEECTVRLRNPRKPRRSWVRTGLFGLALGLLCLLGVFPNRMVLYWVPIFIFALGFGALFNSWLSRYISEVACIGIDGISMLNHGKCSRTIRWDEVKQMRIHGGPRRGFTLGVRTMGSFLMMIIPCGREKDVADALHRQAETLWKRWKNEETRGVSEA